MSQYILQYSSMQKDVTKVSKTITFLYKSEPYWWSKYNELPFEPKQYNVRNNQRVVIDDIKVYMQRLAKLYVIYMETHVQVSLVFQKY